MNTTSAIPQLVTALHEFRTECLPRNAREEAYSGWIAHFLMLQFGARNVVVESHHDGQALSQKWDKWLNPAEYYCRNEISKKSIDPKTGKPKKKSAFGFDIVVTRSDDVDATCFQRRWPQYSQSTNDAKIREAADHLLQFALLIEIKLVDHAAELKITNKMVWDVFRLGATSATVAECCKDQLIPETAFVVVIRGKSDLRETTRDFLHRLRFRNLNALASPDAIPLPHLFLVPDADSEMEHLKPA